MVRQTDFTERLEAKVAEQLNAQRVGYLLGAGSSYLNGSGYPLAIELWDRIKGHIADSARRHEIQTKIDAPGTTGIEHALDLLDDGSANGCEHRHLVANAIAEVFLPLNPSL